MNLSIFGVLVLILVVQFANSRSTAKTEGANCENETDIFISSHYACVENSNTVIGLVDQLVNGRIAYETFKSLVRPTCAHKNHTTCYYEIAQPITGRCSKSKEMLDLRNVFKKTFTLSEYMCQGDGKKYFEFVKNGGAECFYDVVGSASILFEIDEICEDLKLQSDTLRDFDECDNKNVRIFYSEVLDLMIKRFDC